MIKHLTVKLKDQNVWDEDMFRGLVHWDSREEWGQSGAIDGSSA